MTQSSTIFLKIVSYRNITPGYTACDLDPDKHLEPVLRSWMEHNGAEFFINRKEAEDAIKCYIQQRGSTGIVRERDGKLVAFVLSDVDLSARLGMAIEEYRGHDITQIVFTEQFRKVMKFSDFGVGYVPVSNIASRKKMEKLGAYFYEEDFVHCVLRPLHLYKQKNNFNSKV